MNDELERLYLQDVDVMIDALEHTIPALFSDAQVGRRLDKAFRYAHSIKSQAQALGRAGVAREAHELEELLAGLRETRTSGSEAGEEQEHTLNESTVTERVAALRSAFAADRSDAPHVQTLSVNLQQEPDESASSGGSAATLGPESPAPASATRDRDRTKSSAGAWSASEIAGSERSPAAGLPPTSVPADDPHLSAEVRRLIAEAEQRGERGYVVSVALSAETAMPEMRSYLIQTNLERNVAVLASWNESAARESGRDDGPLFHAVVTSDRSETEIRELVQVDEVMAVYVDAVGSRGSSVAAGETASGRDEESEHPIRRAQLTVTELAPLLTAARRLARDMSPDPQDREHLLALLRSASGFAARIRDDLEESLSDTFGPIAHTVRSRVIQLAEDRGKALDVRVLGAWTPIPPGLESTIGDLLLQLARNALDHGLESAEVRKDLGKAAAGVITLGAERGERWVSLWVEDDGAGIDTARVRDAAGGDEVPEGNADDIESEDYELLMDTLTQPGFTTVDGDRHSSGRGVGLDIVRHTVETLLSGRLGLRSQSGSGTRFTLRFPVAAHTLDVIVVAVGPRRLAVPQLLIEEVRDLHPGDDTRTERGERFVALGGSYTPICETGHAAVPEEGGVGILVDGAAGRVVLIADAVVAEERVLRYRNSPYVVYSQALDRRVALLVPLHGC